MTDEERTCEKLSDTIEKIDRVSKNVTIMEVQSAQRLAELNKISQIEIKRRQWLDFFVIMFILLSVSVLAYCGIIDGASATGILGVIAGYVFGKGH